MTSRKPLASRQEVAEYLGVPYQTVAVWAHRGIGPPYLKVGVHCRYRWSDVDKWLADRERKFGPVDAA